MDAVGNVRWVHFEFNVVVKVANVLVVAEERFNQASKLCSAILVLCCSLHPACCEFRVRSILVKITISAFKNAK